MKRFLLTHIFVAALLASLAMPPRPARLDIPWVYSTYLGSASEDQGASVALDTQGRRLRHRVHLRNELSGRRRCQRAAARRRRLCRPLRLKRRCRDQRLLVQRFDAFRRRRRLQHCPGRTRQRLRHRLHPLRGLLHGVRQRTRVSHDLLRRNRRVRAEDPRRRQRAGLLHLPGRRRLGRRARHRGGQVGERYRGGWHVVHGLPYHARGRAARVWPICATPSWSS